MIPLSIDEQRIVVALQKWADACEKAQATNPFSFNGVRAKLLRRVIEMIQAGQHR